MIPPVATGFEGGTAEYFSRRTDPSFDSLAAASIAAEMAIGALLDPSRAARLVDFHAQNPAHPDLSEVIREIFVATWKAPASTNGYHSAIQRTVQNVAVNKLIDLAADENAAQQVRAVATESLRALLPELKKIGMIEANDLAHRKLLAEEIERFLARPDATRKRATPLPTPPGDPIGSK